MRPRGVVMEVEWASERAWRCFRWMIWMCESEGGALFWQVFNDAIEALRVSYRKMNPFCVPFATTNMGSAMLAMDLVRLCAG